MTVGVMLREMSSDEFYYWMAYHKIKNESSSRTHESAPQAAMPEELFEANVKTLFTGRKGVRMIPKST